METPNYQLARMILLVCVCLSLSLFILFLKFWAWGRQSSMITSWVCRNLWVHLHYVSFKLSYKYHNCVRVKKQLLICAVGDFQANWLGSFIGTCMWVQRIEWVSCSYNNNTSWLAELERSIGFIHHLVILESPSRIGLTIKHPHN